MKLDENAQVPLGAYEAARAWMQMKLQEYARRINQLLPLAGGTVTGNVVVDGGTFVFNESGADKDFRAEGDTDANLLSLDASTDRVGVGTATPAAKLNPHVSRTSGANVTALVLSDTVTGAQTAGFGVRLEGHSNGSSTKSAIGFEAGGDGTNNQSQLAIYTQASAGGGLSRRVFWDENGNTVFLVNGTAPTLVTNGFATFELTSNTELKIKVRGSDGTTRSVSLTLA